MLPVEPSDETAVQRTRPPARPLRVLFLTGRLTGQGSQTALVALIRKINPSGFDVHLGSLYNVSATGKLLSRDYPSAANILRHRFDVTSLARFARKLRGRVDAVVTWGMGEPMIWGGIVAKWARTPVSLAVVSSEDSSSNVRLMSRMCSRWSDGVIFDTEQEGRAWRTRTRLPASRIHIIPFGVDTSRFCFRADGAFATRNQLQLPPGSPLCGLATEQYGEEPLRRLFDVARRIRFQMPSVRFALMMPDQPLLSLRLLHKEYMLVDCMHVIRDPDELPSTLSALTVFCCLDRSASTPWPLLQAMAVQSPVVAWDLGQIAGYRHSADTDVAVVVNNSQVAALAVRLIKNPGIARELGEHGRRVVVQHWSLDQMVRRYERVIHATYQRKGKGSGDAQVEPLGDAVEFCGAST